MKNPNEVKATIALTPFMYSGATLALRIGLAIGVDKETGEVDPHMAEHVPVIKAIEEKLDAALKEQLEGLKADGGSLMVEMTLNEIATLHGVAAASSGVLEGEDGYLKANPEEKDNETLMTAVRGVKDLAAYLEAIRPSVAREHNPMVLTVSDLEILAALFRQAIKYYDDHINDANPEVRTTVRAGATAVIQYRKTLEKIEGSLKRVADASANALTDYDGMTTEQFTRQDVQACMSIACVEDGVNDERIRELYEMFCEELDVDPQTMAELGKHVAEIMNEPVDKKHLN